MAGRVKRPGQSADQIVDINNWMLDDEFGVFPVGSKPKRMLVCPPDANLPFLIPGHSYLFKTAVGWQQQQVWSEIIASRIGDLIGLPVPPCFLAVDPKNGETGALIEFFYGYPDQSEQVRFIHASDFMTRILVDKKRGRPHDMRTNLLLSKLLCKDAPGVVQWWAKALAFDALIGNTDRHPDNWGFMFSTSSGLVGQAHMAPLFDNGTSLGYEIQEQQLAEKLQGDHIGRYIARGTHHCGWVGDGPVGHFDLCREFMQAEEAAGSSMETVVRFAMDNVESILAECTTFGAGLVFSEVRGRFVLSLIEARKSALSMILEG